MDLVLWNNLDLWFMWKRFAYIPWARQVCESVYTVLLLFNINLLIMYYRFVCGHEFAGEIVALGASYSSTTIEQKRPPLYATLKVGDKVVAPFTSSCSECRYAKHVVCMYFVL